MKRIALFSFNRVASRSRLNLFFIFNDAVLGVFGRNISWSESSKVVDGSRMMLLIGTAICAFANFYLLLILTLIVLNNSMLWQRYLLIFQEWLRNLGNSVGQVMARFWLVVQELVNICCSIFLIVLHHFQIVVLSHLRLTKLIYFSIESGSFYCSSLNIHPRILIVSCMIAFPAAFSNHIDILLKCNSCPVLTRMWLFHISLICGCSVDNVCLTHITLWNSRIMKCLTLSFMWSGIDWSLSLNWGSTSHCFIKLRLTNGHCR